MADATGASQTTTSAPMNFRLAPGGLDYDSAKWTQIGTVTSTGTETVSVTLSTGSKSGAIPADAILFKPTGLDVARTTYEWDHQNRLTKVTNESAAFSATGVMTLSPRDTTTYAYDVLGRRAAVTYDLVGPADDGGDFRRVSVYDGSQVVWTETGTNREQLAGPTITQALLWAPGVDQLLAIQERLGGTGAVKQPVWALTDHLGTVKDYLAKAPTTGAESALLLTRRYSAFGTPVAAKVWNTLPIATFTDIGGKGGFLYVGQEYDATTGLQYSRARYYDPVSSEFISQDPLGFAGGDTNLYRRAGNSPANATDPSGMIVETGWDAFSLGVGLVSLGYNLRYGTWKDVGYDVLGIVADVGATLLPGVPGGAGVAIRATRLGAQAADAVAASATLQRSIKAVQLANLGANTIQGVESGVNAYDAYQDGRYTEAVFNGIGAGFAGLHLGTSAAGSAGRAARAFGGGFSAGFSETLGRQGSRLYSAGGAAASGIEATANGLRRGVQDLGPTGRGLPIVDSRFTPDIDKLDFGKHLRLNRGGPGAMPSPHAHHILFKKGLGPAQQRLVSEGQEILSRHEIDPIGGLENLVWAPMRVKGQHGIAALQNVVDTLKQVDSFGGSRDDIVDALRQLGEQAARRR